MTEGREGQASAIDFKRYGGTIAGCLIGALLTFGPGAWFMVFWLAIPLVPWTIRGLYRAARYPRERRENSIRIGLWVITLTTVAAWHEVRAWNARTFAQDIADRVERFQQDNRRYPRQLAEIGVSDTVAARHSLGYLWDPAKTGAEPHLIYMGEWVIFSVYRYDFGTRTWTVEYG